MNDKYYMEEAFKEAKKAYKKNEIPVGAIIVNNNSGKIISRGYNRKEKDKLCYSHAEVNAITKASKKEKSWRLNNHTIYVTLKPCNMCIEIIKNSMIDKVVYCCEQTDNQNRKIELIKYDDLDMEEKSKNIIKNKFYEIRSDNRL